MTENDTADFEAVLKSELDLIERTRAGGAAASAQHPTGHDHPSVYTRACEAALAGLAFSGGGIRSATLNLGIIQALAKLGLLSRFDYLSTVSGGGYIGGWLSSLLHRQAGGKVVDERFVEDLQQYLKPHPSQSAAHNFKPTVGFPPVEHKAVRYLRRYSNYLSPRLGLSGDLLAVISIFLRNFILIQLALISLVAGLVLLAHVIGIGSRFAAADLSATLGAYLGKGWAFAAALLVLGVSVWFTGRLLATDEVRHDRPLASERAVHQGVIFPCLLAAWWFAAAVAGHPGITTNGDSILSRSWVWMAGAAVVYAGGWGLGLLAACLKAQTAGGGFKVFDNLRSNLRLALIAVIAGGLLGLLLYGVVHSLDRAGLEAPVDLWRLVAYGPPVFIGILSFIVTLHIGAARRGFSEHDREWLARLGGFLLLYAVAWALAFTLVLYATPAVHWLAGGGLVALATWAAGSGAGAWLARGPATGGDQAKSPWQDLIARLAPWLFIAGLVAIITFVIQRLLFEHFISTLHLADLSADFAIAAGLTLERLNLLPWTATVLMLLAAFGLFLFIALRLDINLFSLHALYCNRLARAFLGATRAGKRKPNPFTGFDAEDDLAFSALAGQRPIPIINTAINMTGGDDLAWQTRRAASFAITPRWAGYETASTQGYQLGRYRPTQSYAGGRPLGTWIAVSGAAASPNMGYHTSPAVAALLTAFNLRLGRWCGNPMRETWDQISPAFAAKPVFAELTGSATAQADWINLTDGGHFENLGVYELLRRRCRLIVVVDAGCDPEYKYEDLANLIRLAWTDLGVNLRFDVFENMHLEKDQRFLRSHYALGRIQYAKQGPEGVLLYLKASLTGNEWPDIRQYADMHAAFPHESTADQFFDENQFEAYRHLGYKILATVIRDLEQKSGGPLSGASREQLIDVLAAQIAQQARTTVKAGAG